MTREPGVPRRLLVEASLHQWRRHAGHSRTDRDNWGRCVTHTASHQRRYTMMAWLAVWGAALAGFVAGAAWNGRVRG